MARIGRPKLTKAMRRDIQVKVMFNKAEMQEIEEAAMSSTTIGGWAREAMLAIARRANAKKER